MPIPISQQIRSLRTVPRAILESQGEAIKARIEQQRQAGDVSEADAAQLVADVNNEKARILTGGSKPDGVMSHVCDKTGRVLSSRIEYPNGRVQTRARNEAGKLTDWTEITPPSTIPTPSSSRSR